MNRDALELQAIAAGLGCSVDSLVVSDDGRVLVEMILPDDCEGEMISYVDSLTADWKPGAVWRDLDSADEFGSPRELALAEMESRPLPPPAVVPPKVLRSPRARARRRHLPRRVSGTGRATVAGSRGSPRPRPRPDDDEPELGDAQGASS